MLTVVKTRDNLQLKLKSTVKINYIQNPLLKKKIIIIIIKLKYIYIYAINVHRFFSSLSKLRGWEDFLSQWSYSTFCPQRIFYKRRLTLMNICFCPQRVFIKANWIETDRGLCSLKLATLSSWALFCPGPLGSVWNAWACSGSHWSDPFLLTLFLFYHDMICSIKAESMVWTRLEQGRIMLKRQQWQ